MPRSADRIVTALALPERKRNLDAFVPLPVADLGPLVDGGSIVFSFGPRRRKRRGRRADGYGSTGLGHRLDDPAQRVVASACRGAVRLARASVRSAEDELDDACPAACTVPNTPRRPSTTGGAGGARPPGRLSATRPARDGHRLSHGTGEHPTSDGSQMTGGRGRVPPRPPVITPSQPAQPRPGPAGAVPRSGLRAPRRPR